MIILKLQSLSRPREAPNSPSAPTNLLTAELSEDKLQNLVSSLIKIEPPQNLIFEDLPVEEAMRNFFENPDKYIV